MTAERFVNVTFGGLDPINGGYLTYSLNVGGGYGTALVPDLHKVQDMFQSMKQLLAAYCMGHLVLEQEPVQPCSCMER